VRRWAGSAVGAAVLSTAALLAGCSSEAPALEPTVVPTTASPTPTASAGSCPEGAYRVTALEGRGSASAIGKGSGGDVEADFSDGTFTISSDGAEPVTVDLGPTNAKLSFDGTITGTYEGEASALRLTTKEARGEVTIKGFGFTRTRSASTLADQLIGQDATAQVVCDDAAGTAQVTLPEASLTLTRKG
jgi:hypothetical protein